MYNTKHNTIQGKARGYALAIGGRDMTRTYQPLSAAELDELKRFAAQKGRTKWKDALELEYWMRGLPVPGFPLLYGLRNTHGPSWLSNLDLSPAAPYFSDAERKVARKLVRAIRQRGYTIRHSDGEDVTDCAKSTEAEIMALLSQTGQDGLSVIRQDGKRVGSFVLIGQGPDGEGDELVADYSWNNDPETGAGNEAVMEEIWKSVISE